MEGDRRFVGSQSLPDFHYARYAELVGLEGVRVESPDEIAPTWERALAARRPFVFEAVTDPEVPPLPPHITLEQAKAMTAALRKDPERGAMVRQTLRGMMSELLPNR